MIHLHKLYNLMYMVFFFPFRKVVKYNRKKKVFNVKIYKDLKKKIDKF